jgi:hypothetical protein
MAGFDILAALTVTSSIPQSVAQSTSRSGYITPLLPRIRKR